MLKQHTRPPYKMRTLILQPKGISFSLFQMEGETDETFLFRIFGWAEKWLLLVTEKDIPEKGPIRNVWNNYSDIQKMNDDELSEELYYMLNNETCRSYEMEGVYARTWRDLLRMEDERRSKTSG